MKPRPHPESDIIVGLRAIARFIGASPRTVLRHIALGLPVKVEKLGTRNSSYSGIRSRIRAWYDAPPQGVKG